MTAVNEWVFLAAVDNALPEKTLRAFADQGKVKDDMRFD